MFIELLAEYDPFLARHIERYGNRGRGNPSYLSSTICEEFVLLMAEEVKQVIINEIASAKYYSFSINSTPDISHTDQLTFTVRYVHEDGMPTERFLKFEEIHSHTGLNLFKTIIEARKDFISLISKIVEVSLMTMLATCLENILVCRPGYWKKMIKLFIFHAWRTR